MATVSLHLSEQRAELPPIVAYDAFAPHFKSYSETRKRYLRKVEEIVALHLGNVRSMLDVGAGDGNRALRIARSANVTRLVLMEPSAGMRALCRQDTEIWACDALEVPDQSSAFEVITCLWNVLGHVSGAEQRRLVLAKLKRLLA